MEPQELLNYSLGALAILSAIFTAFNYFKKPQDKNTLNDALLKQKSEIEDKYNEKRFCDMGTRLDDAFTLAQNHTHTVDIKVDKLIETVTTMGKEITKLSVIIEERIPKK